VPPPTHNSVCNKAEPQHQQLRLVDTNNCDHVLGRGVVSMKENSSHLLPSFPNLSPIASNRIPIAPNSPTSISQNAQISKMHTSIFQLPLHLALLCSTTHALPQQLPQSLQDPYQISYENQHPLTIPTVSKDEHIRGTMHMQATLYPHIPVAFNILPTKTPSAAGELSELLPTLSNKLRHRYPFGINIQPDEDVEVSSTTSRLGGGEAGLYVVFELVEGNEVGRERRVEDMEGGKEARIGRAELAFLTRLFETAIADLDDALRENERGIATVVLEGEVEGVSMRCEFAMSREENEEL